MTEIASAGQLRASYARWALVLVPAIVLLGFLSGAVGQSGPDNPWFAALIKPAIYPPAQTFAIVWSILYALMGLALSMIVTARGAAGRLPAMIVCVVQLLLNLAWSPLFFAAHQITGALILLCVLDVAVLATIALFWRVRPLAAMLLLPYLAWVGFATWLNFEFRNLNPDADGREAAGAVTRIEL